jgi:hypothetical protein
MSIGSVPSSGLPCRLQSKGRHHDDLDTFRLTGVVSRRWEAMSRKEQPEETDPGMKGDRAITSFLRIGYVDLEKTDEMPIPPCVLFLSARWLQQTVG